MKRQQIQRKLARTAESMATSITTGTFKERVRRSPFAARNGEPITTLGHVFSQAGLVSPRGTVLDGEFGLAKVLGTTPDILPVPVKNAIDEIQALEDGRTPSAIRRSLPNRLKNLASALKSAKIRKAYTKSGLFTAAARDAGTFGKTPATTI